MGSRAVPCKAAGMEAAGSVTLNTGLHHFGLHIFETNTHSTCPQRCLSSTTLVNAVSSPKYPAMI